MSVGYNAKSAIMGFQSIVNMNNAIRECQQDIKQMAGRNSISKGLDLYDIKNASDGNI